MKKNSLLLVLGVLLFTTGFANGTPDPKKMEGNIDQIARTQVRLMQQYLHFNEFEYIQIKKLTEKQLADIQTAEKNYEAGSSELIAEMHQIEDTYTAAVMGIINISQSKVYAAYAFSRNNPEVLSAH
ncbi:hypothetical protein [Adhaeribacter aquaticus]|uniref:hypothetical protein n=1 Tax=Adhaeribacter aquaticus TaxID=299567 RepID=UPI0012F88979|nr:hypothetical protein [Adhaeribacter aquaticus]